MVTVFSDMLHYIIFAFYSLSTVATEFFGFMSSEFVLLGATFTVSEFAFGVGLIAVMSWSLLKFLLPTS